MGLPGAAAAAWAPSRELPRSNGGAGVAVSPAGDAAVPPAARSVSGPRPDDSPPCVAAAVARDPRPAGRDARLPPAPGGSPGRPKTCTGRGATADPSAGAVHARTPRRCSPSRCSDRPPRHAAYRAVAPPRERRRRSGRRPGGCSSRRPARAVRAGATGRAAATVPGPRGAGTPPGTARRRDAVAAA